MIWSKFRFNISESENQKRDFLILKFSVLSLILFVLIGYFFVSSIRPSLENFVVSERKNDTVVSINKAANNFLTKADFTHSPQTVEEVNRMAHFFDHASARGSVQTFITDGGGMVIYSNKPEFIGSSLLDNPAIKFVIEKNRSIARFENVSPDEQEKLGLKEVFAEIVPITFGESDKVIGVVYTISRVGLLRKHIAETEDRQVTQIVYGFSALYLVLLIIVWGAAKTIRNQRKELNSYANTLKKKVEERTEKLKESTEKQLRQAEELSRIKDEFIFIASHELRSPATTILGNSEILASDPLLKNLPPKNRAPIDDLRLAGKRLQNLVDDLLNVARIEYGAVQIKLLPTNIEPIIKEVVQEIKNFAASHNVKVVVDEKSISNLPKINIDINKFKEILNNFLTNAIKYNKPNGKISVFVEVQTSNQMIAISVRDTGIGLTKDELSRVFQKFWRAHSGIEGTGLGLWISKQIAYKMKGEITVDSESGKGSTFTVWFHTGES